MKKLILSILFGIAAIWLCHPPAAAHAAEATKVVFISGKPSHGPMSHEHRAGNMLLAKRLNARS